MDQRLVTSCAATEYKSGFPVTPSQCSCDFKTIEEEDHGSPIPTDTRG
jgi:hypothetical protein